MHVETTSTSDGSLLRAVRSTLAEADEAILCVAFASEHGVHLLGKELRGLGPRARMLVTTAFGSTTEGALQRAHEHRLVVGVFNPGGGRTYHPKLYIGRGRNGQASVVIGSVNLTAGLVNNVEIGTWLRGTMDDEPIARAWAWAEERWSHQHAVRWSPPTSPTSLQATFSAPLLSALRVAVSQSPEVLTLGPRPQTNRVLEVLPHGVYVETRRSLDHADGPQLVPASMFELAWSYLATHGELSNRTLLEDLRVHRSSAVCAILARLPGVEVADGPAIRLVWKGDRPSGFRDDEPSRE